MIAIKKKAKGTPQGTGDDSPQFSCTSNFGTETVNEYFYDDDMKVDEQGAVDMAAAATGDLASEPQPNDAWASARSHVIVGYGGDSNENDNGMLQVSDKCQGFNGSNFGTETRKSPIMKNTGTVAVSTKMVLGNGTRSGMSKKTEMMVSKVRDCHYIDGDSGESSCTHRLDRQIRLGREACI